MASPSKYFEKKSRNAADAELASVATEAFLDEKMDDEAIADEMIRQEVEDLDIQILEESVVHPEAQVDSFMPPVVARKDDPTLTEDERLLTELQLRFAWEYCADPSSATKAAIRAGYSKNSASKEASKLLRNEKVIRVIKMRMPAQKRIMRMGKEFLIEAYLEIHNRCMQNVPVMDRDGNPTGYYAFDANSAKNALDGIAKIVLRDPEQEKSEKEEGGKLSASISSISDKIRGIK